MTLCPEPVPVKEKDRSAGYLFAFFPGSFGVLHFAAAVEYGFRFDDEYLGGDVALDGRGRSQGEGVLYGEIAIDFAVDFGIGGHDVALYMGLFADDDFSRAFDVSL